MSSEQIRKRRANQGELLRLLHFRGPLQRGELSRAAGIRKNSVTSIVGELLAAGVLVEALPGNARSPLALERGRFQVAAAAVTRRRVHFGRVHLDGRLAGRFALELAEPPSALSLQERLAAGFTRLLAELGEGGDGNLLGCGVSCPGLIESGTGVCHRAVNLQVTSPVRLGETLSAALGWPVLVESDVRCQLWASTWFDRLGADAENLLYVALQDGVSCAIMTRGRLTVGERFAAGEIGHVRVGDQGRVCSCGRLDCLEAHSSIGAMLQDLRDKLGASAPSDVAELAAAAGEPAVAEVLDRAVRLLARQVAGIVAAIDPRVLVLGTPDRRLSHCLAPWLRRHLYSELIGLTMEGTGIEVGDDTEVAALKGVGGLVFDRAFRSRDFASSGERKND